MNAVNLDEVRGMIESRIRRLESSELTLDDFTSAPASGSRYVSELIAQAKVRGTYDQIQHRSEEEMKAVALKREGRLLEANQVYITLFKNEERFDKPYIWSWCKVLILAKNFKDLHLLLKYLHHFNARFNILSQPHNPDMSAYGAFGTDPELDFSFDGASYLRMLCDDPLDSKERTERRLREYGGSQYWQTHYRLSLRDYSEFCTYFGTPETLADLSSRKQASRRKLTQSSTSTTVSSSSTNSSGCYVATYVYGSYDCPEVWALRRFRDNYLSDSPLGRLFIRGYYYLSPKMVAHLGGNETFRRISKAFTDWLVSKVRAAGYEDGPYYGK